ncbi:GUN4 domain-containing protein [Saccharothrix australiensis]|uniref:GUN4-like protein n=1 Tax=Saccharothrix australiensis TaxID=2072 RepID=A0A495VQR9_9PSEU|nr:GUN4 domain-containing protein [Saccharothrix australiensis]RKT51739.1 GUN4-like protein [Saccharothrix australiensis]
MSLVERCVVGVDVEKFSARPARHQLRIQKELDRMLDEASAQAGLDRAGWVRQPAGDGEVAVLPPDVELVALVRTFVRELDTLLTDHNEDHDPGVRIRLRVAMHTDVLTPGAFGYAGPALVVLSRLLDSAVLRRALRAAPDGNLAQLLSASLYRRAVLPELGGLRPGQFEEVRVDLPEKGFRESAYLHLPHRGPVARPVGSPVAVLTSLVRDLPAPAPARPVATPAEAPRAARVEVAEPPSPRVREFVDCVRDALAAGKLARADRLTTLALLAQAGRTGGLRGTDGALLTDALLTDLDDAWSAASGGRWGFRAQRARLDGLVLTGRRPFWEICSALGWRSAEDGTVLAYPEFERTAENDDLPRYPTLRNPAREDDPQWPDEWATTVLATHLRLRSWER